MKSFLIIYKDKQAQQCDSSLLQQHVTHLKQLDQAGHLMVCGPFSNDTGAMLVIQAKDQLAAEKLIQNDPFILQSYYATFNMTEFKLADKNNQYLMQN